MNTAHKDGFRFLLSVSPKDNSEIDTYEWVSKQLMLEPTNANKKGDLQAKKRNKFYKTWNWSYGTPWTGYWPSTNGKSFSDELLEFLKSLPSDKKIWKELSKECDYSLYIPIEREYFLIEVEFEPILWSELGKRELRIELSSLSRDENHN